MITPKSFQQGYIDNVLHLFRAAKSLYDETTAGPLHRRIFAHNGAVLMKAPTGSGKTIMAGAVAEHFSGEEKAVWFWFAPFKGLVGQSAMSLRDHHPGLRVRDLATDRRANGTRAGDTFVLTWASVVARSADARKIRKDDETFPSLDGFLADLRQMGFRIGIVIDEAHHGIGGNTQSVEFFREVLVPDYCLMITATPDDADAEKFTRAAKISDLHRVTVSREEVVLAGLIKSSVRSIAYISPPDQVVLADFEAAALQDACTMHARIKQELAAANIKLVPLMMVQVSKDKGAIDQTKASLLKLGFSDDTICVHTADEPDENFLSMAVDETKEVLIFKMAAALGFDAPRAFCMVSMRPIKDTDFGTQLIGRIMRVHHRLQGRELSSVLRHGYLFLADHESQAGIASAAEKINQLRSQLTQTSPFIMLTRIGGESQVQLIRNNQPELMPANVGMDEIVAFPLPEAGGGDDVQPLADGSMQRLLPFLDALTRKENQESQQAGETGAAYRYPLKEGSPLRFLTQELPLEVGDLLACMEQQISFNDGALLTALAKDVQIIRIEKSHFDRLAEDQRSNISARIDLEKAEKQAQQLLLRQQYLSAKDLQDHLLKRLAAEFRNHGLAEVAEDDERLEVALALILVRHPGLLREVEKSCSARFSFTRETEPLPGTVESPVELARSFKNIYEIYPADMNPWELEFVKLLDNDPSGTVLWWHRNPPRKKYSVAIVRPDGGRFFPDFVVGVKGRKVARDGILLIETKHAIGSLDSQIKSTVEHKEYGKALMIHWKDWADDQRRAAMTVCYDAQMDKNVLDAVFRCTAMPTY
ncbi:MAG: DEAD/DEAH box helicase family protein [Verrucomicrobiota bacterium]